MRARLYWHFYVYLVMTYLRRSAQPHHCFLSFIIHKCNNALLTCCSSKKELMSTIVFLFFFYAGSETEPQQHQLWQGHPQPLRAGEKRKHRGSVPPSPAQSPPQATQRHAPGAGRHHVPVSLPGCRGAECTAAGHTVSVTQETGMHLICMSKCTGVLDVEVIWVKPTRF